MNTSLTFNEWLDLIHSQITSFCQQSNFLFIHKEKLSTLFVELESFNQKTENTKLSNNPPNSVQINALQSIFSLLISIKKLIDSCKISNALETIINQEVNEPLNILRKFREKFNQFVNDIGLFEIYQDACTIDENQLNEDNINDSKDIVNIITTYLSENEDITLEMTKSLKKRLKEYQDIIENSHQLFEDENDKNREVTEAEYFRRIQEISDTFVDRNDFQKNEVIGKGGYGTVFKGIQKSTGKVVAIKEMRGTIFKLGNLKRLICEVGIMSKVQHFGILPLIGYIPTIPYSIITEYMSGGNLKDRIFKRNAKPLDGTKLTIIALGVAYAMKYMHSKKYIHRDLKPENIILDADDYPFVIDFGLSRILPNNPNECMTTGIGTTSFMAPEYYSDQPYSSAVDVYSYGFTLYVMLTGQNPYPLKMAYFQIVKITMEGQRPKIPSDAIDIAPLIVRCWSQDPKNRPTFDEIVSILERGDAFFPGTDLSKVNSYKNIYIKRTGKIHSSEEKRTDEIKEVDVKKGNFTSTIEKIESNINNKDFMEKIIQMENFIQFLLNACDECESLAVAQKIIKIFTAVLKIQKKLNQSCVSKVFDLFEKFDPNKMIEILNFINSFPDSELDKIKLNSNQLNKFSLFLKLSDISLRLEATNTLIKIINNKCYQKVEFLITCLKEIIVNITLSIAAMPDLLLASLIVVNLLLHFQELHTIFLDEKIFILIVSVFTYDQKSREDIFKEVCYALRSVIIIFRGKLNEEDMKFALLSLQSASKYIVENQLINYVICFINLLELKAFYSVIEKDSKNIFKSCFESFLINCKSDESIFLFLKFCYSLLNDKKTYSCLSSISYIYINFILNSKSSKHQKSIQSIATCCLIQSINDENIDLIITDDLKNFIKKSLQSEKFQNESDLNALRICSALSCRIKGIEYLMKENIIELVEFYLKNETTAKLAIMIYSSFSAIYPCSNQIISSIPMILKMMDSNEYKDLLQYIVFLLANATISSEAAIECAKNISILSETLNKLCSTQITNDFETKKKTIYIIYKIINVLNNIVMCQNAIKFIDYSEDFVIICNASKNLICDDLLDCFLDLFTKMSKTKIGIEALQIAKMSTYLKVKMESMESNDFRRVRILYFLSMCP